MRKAPFRIPEPLFPHSVSPIEVALNVLLELFLRRGTATGDVAVKNKNMGAGVSGTRSAKGMASNAEKTKHGREGYVPVSPPCV